MAENGKNEGETGVITRLSKRGEEAVNRLVEELGRNERVTDALGRAMSAKGKVDERTRRTLGQVGLAAADEIKDLRGRLERLEKRLAAMEGTPARKPTAAKATGTARATTAAKPKPKASTAKKPATGTAKKPSTSARTSPKKPSSSS